MTSAQSRARYTEIYKEYLTGQYTMQELAKKFNTSYGSIDRAINACLKRKAATVDKVTVKQAQRIKRQSVFNKYGGRCAYCGCELDHSWQIDHITPQWHYDRNFTRYPSSFDINGPENLNPACRSCNNYKSGNPLEVFRAEIIKQADRLRRDKPTFRLAERYGLIECKPVERVVFYFETVTQSTQHPPHKQTEKSFEFREGNEIEER